MSKSIPLISVIIPVYNTEKYLMQCVNSVRNQTYSNLEIILVDDGSKDRSGILCDELAHMDERITVVHKENGGSTSARKIGVQVSHGSYISFVDSDDWVEENMCKHYMDLLQKYESSIICGGLISEYPDTMVEQKNWLEEGKYDKKKLEEIVYPNMLYSGYVNQIYIFGIAQYLWAKLYERKAIEKALIELPEDIWNGEDVACVYLLLLQLNSIYIDNSTLYHYRQKRSGSICNRKKDGRFFDNTVRLYSYMKTQFEASRYGNIMLSQLQEYILMVNNLLTSEALDYEIFPGLNWKLPYSDLGKDVQIVLYGAGEVGCSYYEQIKALNFIEVSLWVDKAYTKYQQKGMAVVSPWDMLSSQYDFILIAIEKKRVALEIKNELTQMGINALKILWIPPERVFNQHLLYSI